MSKNRIINYPQTITVSKVKLFALILFRDIIFSQDAEVLRMLKITCPRCKRGIYSEGFADGERIICPNCRKGFTVSKKVKRRVPVTQPDEVLSETGFGDLEKIDTGMLSESAVTVLGEFLLSILRDARRRGSIDLAVDNEISALQKEITQMKSRNEDARLNELKLRVLGKVRASSRNGRS